MFNIRREIQEVKGFFEHVQDAVTEASGEPLAADE